MAILGVMQRDGLIAGDFPTEAQEITLTGPFEYKRGDVLGITNDGRYVLVDSRATDGSQRAVGIVCDDVTVGDGMTVVSNMFIKGEFNRRFLRFGGTDTADEHMRHMTEISLIIRNTRI